MKQYLKYKWSLKKSLSICMASVREMLSLMSCWPRHRTMMYPLLRGITLPWTIFKTSPSAPLSTRSGFVRIAVRWLITFYEPVNMICVLYIILHRASGSKKRQYQESCIHEDPLPAPFSVLLSWLCQRYKGPQLNWWFPFSWCISKWACGSRNVKMRAAEVYYLIQLFYS